jgi:hypothetical protein
MGWTYGAHFTERARNIFFSTASRPILVLIYRVPEEVSLRNVKMTAHIYVVPKSRMVELYLHSRIQLHGVVFN